MIAIWRKETGNLMSHGKGLTPEEVEFLKTLEVGDRLILWDNNPKKGDSKPNYTLKKHEPFEKKSSEF